MDWSALSSSILQLELAVGRFLWESAFVWMPLGLGYVFWRLWLNYVRQYWIASQEWVLLEIKMPREITKSPAAMEVVLTALHQTSEGNLIDKFIKGRVRSWFSLELVSTGGTLHFYIRTQRNFKNLIEAQIYSQYPQVEVHEVDDYVRAVPYDPSKPDWDLWAMELKFLKEDAYPIKTYIDYGLDKDPKEEFKIDPMLPMLEMLGSLGPSEHAWVQWLITATRDRFHKPGTWFGKQNWRDEAKKVVDKLTEKEKDKGDKENALAAGELKLTSWQREVVKAVERSLSKLAFDTGIRMVYTAPKDIFSKAAIAGLSSSVKQYNSEHLNGFKPLRSTSFDYPWQDPTGRRLTKRKRKMFRAYCERGYFYVPHSLKPMVLNTEELATMYHFPGQVAETPTLDRIGSKRSEPPANLPIN